MRAYEKEIEYDDFEEQLNDSFGPTINICGLLFEPGTVFREIDPIAFDQALSAEPCVWACDECNTEYDNEAEAEECCAEDEDND